MLRTSPMPIGEPSQQSRNLVKKNDGTIVMRTETVEERPFTKEGLLGHKHFLEMELLRIESAVVKTKEEIKEVEQILEDIEKI